MKPTHERNQEWLPPKKRDLPINSSSAEEGVGGGGGGGGGLGAGEETSESPSSGATGNETQGSTTGEWMRVQPGLHYSVESSDGMSVPVDQYGMVYKLSVPSVSYSPTSLHPVLSHISPAYTVPSPLLQHPGLPYHPLGYAQIPHPSLQFVSSPYAVPYAVPPGFVPNPLISPQSAIAQPHHVSHLVPYPPVIQEGVVSPPPQSQTSVHAFAKVAAPGSVPLVLSPEQAAQQHLGTVGGLPGAEVGPRGVPVFYHPPGSRAAAVPLAVAYGDSQGTPPERKMEVNGGEVVRGPREQLQDSGFPSKNTRVLHAAPGSGATENLQSRNHGTFRPEARGSPGQSSTPDTDLEVQQVVGRLASPGSHKEVSFGPLNLSQGSQRAREAPPVARGTEAPVSVRTPYTEHTVRPGDARATTHQPQLAHKAMILANGQQVLVPLDYHQAQHYGGLHEEGAQKPPEPSARMYLPERPGLELAVQQQQGVPVAVAIQSPGSVAVAPSSSHFMKGAIIQLATGELKRVEDLQTQDFVRSAEVSGGLKIDSSMVVDVRKSQQRPGLVSLHFSVGEQQSKVAIDVPPEHPFFVFGQGWSSCSPDRTAQLYGLACHPLQVGDVCVSIALQPPQKPQQPSRQPQHLHPQHQHQQQQQTQTRTPSKAKPQAGVISRSMGPPAPHPQRTPTQIRLDRTHRERDEDCEEEPMEVGSTGQGAGGARPQAPSADLVRSHGYYLHTEGQLQGGAGPLGSPSLGAAQRRWSVPGLQRYTAKGEEEEARPSMSPAGPSRPTFIPQEVKLSIEGRSNAGK